MLRFRDQLCLIVWPWIYWLLDPESCPSSFSIILTTLSWNAIEEEPNAAGRDRLETNKRSKTTREDCRETHFKQTSLEHSMTQQQKQNAALKTHRRQPESVPLNICIDLINCTVNYWNCKILVYNSTVLVLLFFSASWNLIILYLIIRRRRRSFERNVNLCWRRHNPAIKLQVCFHSAQQQDRGGAREKKQSREHNLPGYK